MPSTINGTYTTKTLRGGGEFVTSGCRTWEECPGDYQTVGKAGRGNCGCSPAERRDICRKWNFNHVPICTGNLPMIKGIPSGGQYGSGWEGECGPHKTDYKCKYSQITNVKDIFDDLWRYFDEPDLSNIKRDYCNALDFGELVGETRCDNQIINRTQKLEAFLGGSSWYTDDSKISNFETVARSAINMSSEAQNFIKSKIEAIPTNIQWSTRLILCLNNLYDTVYKGSIVSRVVAYCNANQGRNECSCFNALKYKIDDCTANIPGCTAGSRLKEYFNRPTTSETVKQALRNQFEQNSSCRDICNSTTANTQGILRAVEPATACSSLTINSCASQIIAGGNITQNDIDASCKISNANGGSGVNLNEDNSKSGLIAGGEKSGNKTKADDDKKKYYIGGAALSIIIACCCCLILLLLVAM